MSFTRAADISVKDLHRDRRTVRGYKLDNKSGENQSWMVHGGGGRHHEQSLGKGTGEQFAQEPKNVLEPWVLRPSNVTGLLRTQKPC